LKYAHLPQVGASGHPLKPDEAKRLQQFFAKWEWLEPNAVQVFQRDLELTQEGEQQKALQIARQLLDVLDVLDVETISQKTGLSVAEIRRLSSKA